MSLLEGGGEFICRKHDYRTSSVEDWNNHCDGDAAHVESGSTVCISCGEQIEFSNLPYQKIDATGSKNIRLKCNDCHAKEQASQTTATITKLSSTNKGAP